MVKQCFQPLGIIRHQAPRSDVPTQSFKASTAWFARLSPSIWNRKRRHDHEAHQRRMAFYPKQCCRHQNARVFRFQPKKEVVPLFVLVVGHILLLRRCCCHRDNPFLLQRYYRTSYASQIRILCVSIHKQDSFRVFNQYLLVGVLFHGTAESS